MKLHNSSKGQIAQLKCELECAKKNFISSLPTTPAIYDLLIDDGKKIYRAQIKYSNCFKKDCKNTLQLKLGGATLNREFYTEDDFDWLLVFLPSKDVILKYEAAFFHEKSSICINLDDKNSEIYYMKFLW